VEKFSSLFFQDIERNDGSEEKPYFMSRDLHKIMGYMEDKDGEEEHKTETGQPSPESRRA